MLLAYFFYEYFSHKSVLISQYLFFITQVFNNCFSSLPLFSVLNFLSKSIDLGLTFSLFSFSQAFNISWSFFLLFSNKSVLLSHSFFLASFSFAFYFFTISNILFIHCSQKASFLFVLCFLVKPQTHRKHFDDRLIHLKTARTYWGISKKNIMKIDYFHGSLEAFVRPQLIPTRCMFNESVWSLF